MMRQDTLRYTNQTPASRQHGLSLIELMISIALGIFLTWGALQAFLSGKQTYSMQQAVSRIQETGRLGQEFMSFDIRSAGANGCGARQPAGDTATTGCDDGVNMLNNSGNVQFDFGKTVFGIDNNNGNATFNGMTLNPAPKAGTDILVTRNTNNLGLELVDEGKANDANLNTFDTGTEAGACTGGTASISGLCEGDVLVVSDCTRTKIFQVTNLTSIGGGAKLSVVHSQGGGASPGNRCSSWGGNGGSTQAFQPGASIMKATSNFYYVAVSPTTGRPGLYKQTLTGSAQELLEGVEDLQLEFGVDNNGDFTVDQYKTANNVSASEWDSWDGGTALVRSVRYSLLVRSEENILDAAQTYTYNGQTVTAADKRLRQVFSSAVGIRNRLD